MASRSSLVALLVAALAAGCAEGGRSLVIVDVAVDPSSPQISEVSIAVTATATGRRWHVERHWSGEVLKLGIYLPADFQGAVTTTACGLDGDGRPSAHGVGDPLTVTVTPGTATHAVRVMLAAGAGSAAEGCAITDGGSDEADATGEHPAVPDGGPDGATDRPDATPDADRDADSDGNDAGSDGSDAAADGPAVGFLGYAVVPRTSGVGIDLTAVGTIDWSYWGFRSPGSFNHKASGGGKIADLATAQTEAFANSSGWFDWTDGTPTTSASHVDQGVRIAGPGPLFCTVEAATTLRTLRIYHVVDGAMMKMHLSDGSAPDLTVIANFATNWLDVRFRAATAGATLSVRWDIFSTADTGNGSLGLFGAALF